MEAKISLVFSAACLLPLLIFSGCTHGHCNRDGEPAEVRGSRKVWVYKYDNSKQCEPKSGISEKEMASQLLDIKIYSMKKQSDGLSRVQVCGALTGSTNAYEIKQKDVPLAETLGFKKWNF